MKSALDGGLDALAAAAGPLAGDVAGGVAAVGVQAQSAATEGRQVRVVRRWAYGHRPRAAAEEVAQPACTGLDDGQRGVRAG